MSICYCSAAGVAGRSLALKIKYKMKKKRKINRQYKADIGSPIAILTVTLAYASIKNAGMNGYPFIR